VVTTRSASEARRAAALLGRPMRRLCETATLWKRLADIRREMIDFTQRASAQHGHQRLVQIIRLEIGRSHPASAYPAFTTSSFGFSGSVRVCGL
jgi:hypothetical protein